MNRITRAAEALGVPSPRNLRSKLAIAAATILAITSLTFPVVANAAALSKDSVALSNPQPSTLSNYTFTVTAGGGVTTGTTIGCIQFQFNTNAAMSGSVPTGMNTVTDTPTVDAATNFVPAASLTTVTHAVNGTIQLKAASAQTVAGSAPWTVQIDAITNSSTAGTAYYLGFTTFSSTTCTGAVDTGTVQYIINAGSLMSLTVNGTLSFSVAAETAGTTTCNGATSSASGSSTPTTIQFGVASTGSNSIVCQILSAATNAANGFTIFVRDSGQMTNQQPPANTLADFASGTNASPVAFSAAGTEAYGYTTDASSEAQFTSNKWAGFNHTNAGNSSLNNVPLATSTTPVSAGTYNIGYQAGISGITKPGSYQTTVIYTCTPVY